VSSKRDDGDRGEKSPEPASPAPDPGASGSGSIDVALSGPQPAVTPPGSSGSIDVSVSGSQPAVASPGSSGSIDVSVSGSQPAVASPGSSGSIDVAVSGSQPAAAAAPRSSGSIDVAVSGSHPVAAVPESGSGPVASGRLPSAATAAAAAAHDPHRHPRLEAAKEAAKEALGSGVAKLGTGIGKLGTGFTHLGERSHKVPLVGAGVSAIGESLSTVGESLHELPRVARTRRGRLLVRSTLLGFLLVFGWIAGIIALQVRGIDAPDFRPAAEQILSELSKGSEGIERVYEAASPRFHEWVRKDRFIDSMTDMNATIGRFIEITAINESLVTNNPTGRVGRVSLTVAYERGKTRASVSLHWDQGRWKLLGVGVDVPAELKITKAQREERVQACKDPMDPKKCDLFVAANTILEQLRDGHADQVWDNATKLFQKQEEKSRFVMLQTENLSSLGEYRRIIAVTEAKLYSSGSTATYDILTEYTKSQGVRTIFGFYRRTRQDPWRLTSLKLVVPMPRADAPLGTGPETKPTDLPPGADGSGGSGSGSNSGTGTSSTSSGSSSSGGSGASSTGSSGATTGSNASGSSTGSGRSPSGGGSGSGRSNTSGGSASGGSAGRGSAAPPKPGATAR